MSIHSMKRTAESWLSFTSAASWQRRITSILCLVRATRQHARKVARAVRYDQPSTAGMPARCGRIRSSPLNTVADIEKLAMVGEEVAEGHGDVLQTVHKSDDPILRTTPKPLRHGSGWPGLTASATTERTSTWRLSVPQLAKPCVFGKDRRIPIMEPNADHPKDPRSESRDRSPMPNPMRRTIEIPSHARGGEAGWVVPGRPQSSRGASGG